MPLPVFQEWGLKQLFPPTIEYLFPKTPLRMGRRLNDAFWKAAWDIADRYCFGVEMLW